MPVVEEIYAFKCDNSQHPLESYRYILNDISRSCNNGSTMSNTM